MLSMALGWIPIVGPIIDGVVSIFSKFQDTELGKYQVDGQTDIAAWKAANELTLGFKDSIPVRIARDIIMFPGSVWCGLFIWDKIVAIHYPSLVWGVASLNGSMQYLPFALMTFFFGMAAIRK